MTHPWHDLDPDDPEYRGYRDIDELQPHRLAELHRFFEDYKKLERKEVRVEEFSGPEEAARTVREAIERYAAERPDGTRPSAEARS